MAVMLAKPLVIPMRSPAKLGAKSKWLQRNPLYTPAFKPTAAVSRATAADALEMNDIATNAAAPPQ